MPHAWEVDPADVVDLPIDALALMILRDAEANREWNSYNWVNAANRGYGSTTPAARAVAEAWGWLYSRGLVSPDPSQSAAGAMFVTRAGHHALENGLDPVYAAERLQMELHPFLQERIRRLFLLGESALAAFEAMKLVEVRVRSLASASDSLIGVRLMREAFKEGGPLRDPTMDGGEQVARMEMFSSAIGMFKNPTSHREIEFDDPTEASEVVLLADLLMRILDRVERDLPY